MHTGSQRVGESNRRHTPAPVGFGATLHRATTNRLGFGVSLRVRLRTVNDGEMNVWSMERAALLIPFGRRSSVRKEGNDAGRAESRVQTLRPARWESCGGVLKAEPR
jgi:hypothetical protein